MSFLEKKNGKVKGQKGPCLADAKMSYKSLRCKSSVKKNISEWKRATSKIIAERREEGRRIKSVARCGGELCRKNKSESKSPSLVIAGSWPAVHSPNREWEQKIRKRKARGKDQGKASGMPAARVHG